MRRFNALLSAVLLALLILHGVVGSMQMTGLTSAVLKWAAWGVLALTVLHGLIGIKLTAASVMVWKRTRAPYFRENMLFWTRRISGLAIIVLLVFHISAFGYLRGGTFRLHAFDTFRLMTQILLVLSVAVHLASNMRPLLVALGVRSFKKWLLDILFVLSVLMVLMALAVVVYYLRWRML